VTAGANVKVKFLVGFDVEEAGFFAEAAGFSASRDPRDSVEAGKRGKGGDSDRFLVGEGE
jgi:hypothetical protein